MDVGAVLVAVREQRGWTQRELALRAGTSRAAVASYETGKASPTVATLNRILAAAGLQIRAELEPLRADLVARVQAARAEPAPLDVEPIKKASAVLEAEQVAWGLDAETALCAHGYGFASDLVQVAVCFDQAVREWFFRSRVRGTGGEPVSWFDADLRSAQDYLGPTALGPFGMVAVRLLSDPPKTVRLEVASAVVVPVLTTDEVGRGRPDLAEVLDRLRQPHQPLLSRATPCGGVTPP
jgi:transcriptional regulator with XRE-family HTH domain